MAPAPAGQAIPDREVPMAELPAPPGPPIADTGRAPTRDENDVPCFVTWLRAQDKGRGALGELAKAARSDPSFPRRGSVEDVRVRFNRAGADGDAFAALDDAERDYDRMILKARANLRP